MATNFARFTINGSASAQLFYEFTNGQSLTFALENVAGVLSVTYSAYDPNDATSPLATIDAPQFAFSNGAPSIVKNPASAAENVAGPATSVGAAWIIRATATMPSGPPHVFERKLILRNGQQGLTIPGESTQGGVRGWADEICRLARGLLAVPLVNMTNVATAAALAANTRTGNVLQANANGALTVDGVAATVGLRVLVKNEATTANNGVYSVTQVGSAGAPWILTRANDASSSSQFASGTIYGVLSGTANAGSRFALSVPPGFTLNTDAVTYAFTDLSGIAVGTEVGHRPEFNGTTYVPKRFCITPNCDLTGGVDAAPAINAALATRDGAWVNLPDGVYKIGSPIVMNRQGNTLTGSPRKFRQPYKIFNNGYVDAGTLLNVTHTGKGIDIEQPNCGVDGLEIYYPNQNPSPATTALGQLTACDYTFYVASFAHGASISNVTSANPYRFVYFAAGGGLLENLKGFPLLRGITFPRCGAAPRVHNVQFNPVGDYSNAVNVVTGNTYLAEWVKANGVACVMDGIEGYDNDSFNVFGYNVAIWYFDEDNDGFTGVYGTWANTDFEACNTIVLVSQSGRTYQPLTNEGGRFIGGSWVPEVGGYGVDFQDTAAPANVNNRALVALDQVFMHSGVAGMGRAVWMRSTSYSHFSWDGGSGTQIVNELVRNDSPSGNGRIDLDLVRSATGTRRKAGVGDIIDNRPVYL